MFLLHWVQVGVAMLSLAPPPTTSFSRGASPASCQEMTPGHIRAHPQDPRHSYVSVRTSAASYRPGQLVTVTVRSSRDFMGFLLQARGVGNRSAGGEEAAAATAGGGSWALTPPGAHTLRCLADADAVTHSDKQLKRNLSFVWRAPDAPVGDVRFYVTVVQSYFVYWASIESAVLRDGSRTSASVTSRATETFTIPGPPALRVVEDPNDSKKKTKEQTTRRNPTRRSTRSHVDTSTKTHVDTSTKTPVDTSTKTHVDTSTKTPVDTSTKTPVSPVSPEDIRVSSLVTLREETSGVTEEGRTKDAEPPTVQETPDLVRELQSLVPPRWTGPTESQTAELQSTSGTRFKTSSPNPTSPLSQSHVATEDDPPSRQTGGTSSGLKTSPRRTLVLSSTVPPRSPDGSRVLPGSGAPKTDAAVHDAQTDRTEPWTEPLPFGNRPTQNPPLSPNGTLSEGSDGGGFQTSPGTTSLSSDSVSWDASSASSHLSSSSSASGSSSVGTSCPTSENSSSASTTDRPNRAPAHRLPVQPSSANPPRPTEDPSPLSSPVSSSTSLVPSPAPIRPTSPGPGPSPVPRRSLNAAVASSPAADRPTTRQAPTPDPNRTPARTAVHPNPDLEADLGREARPNVPDGKPQASPEAPAGEGRRPDVAPRHSDWELGMLLGCSAGLGMVLVVALRYVYRQACGGRTGVTLNDREREYARGARGLIHVQECGDLVRVRKIRENSFVLLAEYDILAAPAD